MHDVNKQLMCNCACVSEMSGFYRGALCMRYMLLSCVRLSVTSWYCTKTALFQIMETTSYSS